MKKTVIFTVLLCIVALSCAYAGKASLVAQVSPYSLQTVPVSGETYVSTYGFGAKGGFRYDVYKGLNVGFDVDFGVYRFKELDSDYSILCARVLAGYNYSFNSSLFAQAELGAAMEFRKTVDARVRSIGLNLYLGCGYAFSDKLALTLGADVGAGFQNGKDKAITNFVLRTQVGALMTL